MIYQQAFSLRHWDFNWMLIRYLHIGMWVQPTNQWTAAAAGWPWCSLYVASVCMYTSHGDAVTYYAMISLCKLVSFAWQNKSYLSLYLMNNLTFLVSIYFNAWIHYMGNIFRDEKRNRNMYNSTQILPYVSHTLEIITCLIRLSRTQDLLYLKNHTCQCATGRVFMTAKYTSCHTTHLYV